MKRYNAGQIVLLTVALMIVGNIVGFLLSNPGYVPPIMRWDEPMTDELTSVPPLGPHGTLIVCDQTYKAEWCIVEGQSFKHNGTEFITQSGHCYGA